MKNSMKSTFFGQFRFALVALAAVLGVNFSQISFSQARDTLHAGLSAIPAGQKDLAAAQDAHRGADFIEVSGVTVTDVLPDDTFGSRHQKWVVTLANGRNVAGVYNIDVTPRLPLKIGDVIGMGGQFIYDRDGGLMHWLHEDSRGHRQNGYVEINSVRYGANDPTGIYTK